MQPRHHYELAFEEYLRSRRIPYVAVHEARKALLPEGRAQHGAGSLKSFDFVLYGEGGNLLADVKGRKVATRHGSASGRLECWVTQEDVDALTAWEGLFGDGFHGAFVFVYWCEQQPALPLFEEIFEFKGRWYALRVIRVGDYARAMRARSARWRTVHLAAADFDRLSGPVSGAWGGSGRRIRAVPATQPWA